MEKRGKKTWFAGKEQKPVTTNLTTDAHQSLDIVKDEIVKLEGHCSRSDLLEYGWRVVMGLPVPKELKSLIRRAQEAAA